MLRRLTVPGVLWLAACAVAPVPGEPAALAGDEIVVAGRLFHTGARVVKWWEPPFFDAYRPHARFDPSGTTPRDAPHRTARYDRLRRGLPPAVADRVERDGWTVEDLRGTVRQIVIHYDAAGSSRECFRILQDVRGLSAHFLLDTDGTVYQTLDVAERAWHAGIANDRSVGIEIANHGACPAPEAAVRRPAGRSGLVSGTVRGQTLWQEPFTDEQYEALGRLVAALARVLDIPADVPRDSGGRVLADTLPAEDATAFTGLLGHLHVSGAKVDPGPAFDWERFLGLLPRPAAR